MTRGGWRSWLRRLRIDRLLGAAQDPISVRYWQSRPFGALWPLLGAMVLLFSVLPVLGDVGALGRHPLWLIGANALIVASYVIGIFWASIRRRFAVGLVVATAFGMSMMAMDRVVQRVSRPAGDLAAIERRLRIDTMLITAAVAGSYALFIAFLFRESGVLARLRGEVALASLIHARLVPPVDTTVGGWHCYGRSVASSEMGGDLLDVVAGPDARPTHWTAYVTDVSGHGIGAGLFMGVVKTALRMALRQHEDVPSALAAANTALHDQKRRDMFATLALLRGGPDGVLTACIAGHVPVLHWSAGTRAVALVGQQQLPLGVRRHQSFAVTALQCLPGDLLAIVSDGVTEVFDIHGDELGLDAVHRCLESDGALPLAELYARITAMARAHGPIRDDETILLLRREA